MSESCYMYLQKSKYLASIIDDLVLTCDEIIEDTKPSPTNFNQKYNLWNKEFLYFTYLFVNYYRIIDSC